MDINEVPILFQDEYFVIVDKPSGLLVHAYKECTDRNNLMKIVNHQIGHYLYPLHRIDRPVSGIVVFGLEKEVSNQLKITWHDSTTVKKYIALVKGKIEDSGTFNFDLTNEKKIKQKAITHYKPLEHFADWNTLVEVSIDTGRKHQIRRHFSRRCYQIIGDTAHGKGIVNRLFREKYDLHRIFLHAAEFEFIHPVTKELIKIHSPLPFELTNALQKLREESNKLLHELT